MYIEDARKNHGLLDRLNAIYDIAKDHFVCSPGVVEAWSVYENVEFTVNCGMTRLVFLSDFKDQLAVGFSTKVQSIYV